MQTPPIGAPDDKIVEFVDALVQESSQDPRRQAWEQDSQRCMDLYIGNHWDGAAPVRDTTRPGDPAFTDDIALDGRPQSRLIRITYNRVQNAIISLLAVQSSDPPKITFAPRESGEPPLCYLNADLPEAQPFLSMIQQQVATGQQVQAEAEALAMTHGVEMPPPPPSMWMIQPDPTQPSRPWTPDDPLPPEFATVVKQEIDAAKMQSAQLAAQGLPAPPPPPENLYIEVSDLTTAEALQTIFDSMWEQMDGQQIFVENVLNKNILGWQPTLYEFDPETKVPVLTNVEHEQIYPDPIRSTNRRQQYDVYVEKMPIDEAVSKYPQFEVQLRANTSEGGVRSGGHANNAPHLDQNFKREFVTIRTAWVRGQMYPDKPDDALQAGKVAIAQLPTGEPAMPMMDELGSPVIDENGVQQFHPAPTRQAFVDPQTQAELIPPTPPAPPTPANPNGLPGTPGQGWPMHRGVRQITVIHEAGIKLDDKESPFGDLIPITININTPIPFSYLGQGEPVRLDGIQRALNHVLSAIVTHQRYTAYPPEAIPQEVADELPASLQKCRTEPGQRMVIPPHLSEMVQGDLKKLIQTLDVPEMPPDAWKLVSFLAEAIDKEANQTDVMQGNASSSWSGDAIASLQNAANQLIRAKSQRTEFWLKEIARLTYHSIVNHMTPDDWKRYCSKYPYQAIQALHTRAKSIGIDIGVTITSGSGATKAQETTNLIGMRNAGVPVSDPELIERAGLDPDSQLQQQVQYLKKRAEMMPQQPVQPGQPGQPGQETTSGGKQPKPQQQPQAA